MTEPWKVASRNLTTDFKEIVRMEREFIGHWSRGLDLHFMMRTSGIVVTVAEAH